MWRGKGCRVPVQGGGQKESANLVELDPRGKHGQAAVLIHGCPGKRYRAGGLTQNLKPFPASRKLAKALEGGLNASHTLAFHVSVVSFVWIMVYTSVSVVAPSCL